MSDNDRKDGNNAAEDYDPRPVSDAELREQYTREQVEQWRREADEHHSEWFSVMDNSYGKD